jgi:hypothetical protein
MGEKPTKPEEPGLVLNLELAKTLFKWITTLIGLLGWVVTGTGFLNKDAGEHLNHSADDPRVQKLETERNERERLIVDLTGNLRACQQLAVDQKEFYINTSAKHSGR